MYTQPLTAEKELNLWACARSSEKTPLLAQLLQEAAPPDDRNDFGETALHVAATHGNDEAVQLLLRYGASLLVADWESGWTPLHRSLYHQHLTSSLLLLRHAQTRYGKQFVQNYLHETRDHAQQSPMQLLTSILHKQDFAHVAEGGHVYTFGKRDYQLGYHLPNADVQVTPRLVEFPASSPIIQLSASKYHTIALNAAGMCFVWGFGKGGRLGTGNEFDRIEPTQIMSLTTTPIKKVVAGENHSMALSQTGQIFSWGSNSFGQLGHPEKSSSSQSRSTPKRVDALRFRVMADIAASGCHSAAIDAEDGVVYTWGSNRRGQLGRKEGCGTDQADAMPRSLDALRLRHPVSVLYGNYDSVRATKVALSDSHTCVVLQCSHNGRSLGQVWQFGYGSFRPSRVKFPSPTSIMSEAVMCDTWIPTCKQRGMDIVDVSCAQNHSIALSADGSVFTWGHNPPALSHALNTGSSDRPTTSKIKALVSSSPTAPQKVRTTKYGAVASVCASQNHCAVITQQGDLVTWGCGQQGVLGHGRGNTWQPNPKRVAGVKKAVAVAAGHQHMAVLVAPVLPNSKAVARAAAADEEGLPSLVELVEKEIMAYVDVTNCAQVWQYAERYAALRLQAYCQRYMQNNWDVMLDAVGRERLETLFQLMLPPMNGLEMNESLAVESAVEEPVKEKKSGKLSSAGSWKRGGGTSPSVDQKEEDTSCESRANGPIKSCKQNGRHKSNKFVPLTVFLSSTSTHDRDSSSPWGGVQGTSPLVESSVLQGKCKPSVLSVPDTLLEAFPLPEVSMRKGSMKSVVSRQYKASGGCHSSASPRLTSTPLSVPDKHVIGYDGSEHEQVRAFSLDDFLKQPPRRGTRGKRSAAATPIWHSSDSTVASEKEVMPPKTLKEIQEEEKMAVDRERKAKARISGFGHVVVHRPESTMNSWGLCRPPDLVSLTDVQKLQEEQEFLEQQRQILMAIEREQAEKARAASGHPSQRPVATKNKRAARIPKQGRWETTNAAVQSGDLSLPVGNNSVGDNERKRNKLKKAKERKAARKAAGETFAASDTRDTGRKPKFSSKPKSNAAKKKLDAVHVKPWQPRQNEEDAIAES